MPVGSRARPRVACPAGRERLLGAAFPAALRQCTRTLGAVAAKKGAKNKKSTLRRTVSRINRSNATRHCGEQYKLQHNLQAQPDLHVNLPVVRCIDPTTSVCRRKMRPLMLHVRPRSEAYKPSHFPSSPIGSGAVAGEAPLARQKPEPQLHEVQFFLDSGMRVTNNTNDKCCKTVDMKHSSDHFVDLTAARTGVCQTQGRIAARRGQASPTKQTVGNHGMQHFVLTAGSNKIWTNHDNPQKPPIHTKNETSNLFARKFVLQKRYGKKNI